MMFQDVLVVSTLGGAVTVLRLAIEYWHFKCFNYSGSRPFPGAERKMEK